MKIERLLKNQRFNTTTTVTTDNNNMSIETLLFLPSFKLTFHIYLYTFLRIFVLNIEE